MDKSWLSYISNIGNFSNISKQYFVLRYISQTANIWTSCHTLAQQTIPDHLLHQLRLSAGAIWDTIFYIDQLGNWPATEIVLQQDRDGI